MTKQPTNQTNKKFKTFSVKEILDMLLFISRKQDDQSVRSAISHTSKNAKDIRIVVRKMRENDEETTYTNHVQKCLEAIVNELASISLEISRFGRFNTMSYKEDDLFDGERTVTISSVDNFVNTICSPGKVKGEVVRITSLLLKALANHETVDDIMTPVTDEKDELLTRFLDSIDEQAGKGGGTAYILYPYLHATHHKDLKRGLKRHVIAGSKPSTGKSILGKIVLEAYRNLSTTMEPRVEQTGSYTQDIRGWNNRAKNWPVIYIDDDGANSSVSRDEFYKNFHATNMFITGDGNAASHQSGTFEGYTVMNTNNFTTDMFEREELSKRVYIVHMTQNISDNFTDSEVARLHDIGNDFAVNGITHESIIAELNDRMEDAIQWLNEYIVPDVTDELADSKVETSMIEFLDDVMKDGNTDRVLFSELKSVFNAKNGRVLTADDVKEMTNGKYIVKRVRLSSLHANPESCVIRVVGKFDVSEIEDYHMEDKAIVKNVAGNDVVISRMVGKAELTDEQIAELQTGAYTHISGNYPVYKSRSSVEYEPRFYNLVTDKYETRQPSEWTSKVFYLTPRLFED